MNKRKVKFVMFGIGLLLCVVPFLPTFREDGALRTFQLPGYCYSVYFLSNTQLRTSDYKTLQYFDVSSGKLLRQRLGNAYLLSPDGQFSLGSNEVTEVETGKQVSVLQQGKNDWLIAPVFSASNDLIASPCKLNRDYKKGNKNREFSSGSIGAWRVKTGELVWVQPTMDDSSSEVYKHPVAFSPDGKWLVEATAKNGLPPQSGIQLRDVRTGKIVRVLVNNPDVGQLGIFNSVGWNLITFSPDGTLIAAVGGDKSVYSRNGHDGAVYVWEVSSGRLLWKGWKPESMPQVLMFSPDSSRLACGNTNYGRRQGFGDGEVTLWDVKNGSLLRTFSSDTLFDRLTFRVNYLLKRKSPNGRVVGDKSDNMKAIAFSPDGKLLAAGDEAGLVKVWPVP